MQGKELLINTLKNTGLFEKPESDLRDIFDLKTSGKEAFLLGCYGSDTLRDSYYLYSDEVMITPPSESDLLKIPPIPLNSLKFNDFPEVTPFSALNLIKKEPQLLDRILREDKYLVFRSKTWLRPGVTDKTRKQYAYRYRKEILELREEVIRRGIDPINVLVINGEITTKHEGFITPYLAGVKLREEKYLVSQSVGMTYADLFAYRASDFGSGAFLAGLVLGIEEIKKGESKPSTCLVEDEAQERVCQDRHGISQALGYLYESGGYFGKAFVAAPLMAEYQIEEAEKRGVGVITFNEKGEIIFREGKEDLSERQSEIAEEVKNRVYLARECFNFLRQKLHF